jgi:hypothetical protein
MQQRARRSAQTLGVMTHILVALIVGLGAYVTVLCRQTNAKRCDPEVWQDLFNIAAVCSLVLVPYVTIAIFTAGPNASGEEILEQPFKLQRYEPWTRWMFYAAGFSAVSFAAMSALHVLVLKCLSWMVRKDDA